MRRAMSSAYRKPDTGWQRLAGLSTGRDLVHADADVSRIAGASLPLLRPAITVRPTMRRASSRARHHDGWLRAGRGRVVPRDGTSLRALPTLTDAAVSEANIELAVGNRCVSIGHKSLFPVPSSGLGQRRAVRLHQKRGLRPRRHGMRCRRALRRDCRLLARQRG